MDNSANGSALCVRCRKPLTTFDRPIYYGSCMEWVTGLERANSPFPVDLFYTTAGRFTQEPNFPGSEEVVQ